MASLGRLGARSRISARGVAVAIAAASSGLPCSSWGYPLPPDAGAISVQSFGAKGDGRSDDTRAIRAAIDAARADGNHLWPARVVFFPAGTYLVSDTLFSQTLDGRYSNSMALMGEARSTVKILLEDHAPGFGDARSPKPVVYATSGLLAGSARAGGKDYRNQGEGNDAYGNYVQDMTIDVGHGNPGAVALDFLANNVGAIRGVQLLAPDASGHTAISLQRKWPGPLLIENVEIRGYRYGIAVRHHEYSVTLDNVTLSRQRAIALSNNGNSLAIHDLRIEGAGARAVENSDPQGLIVADGLQVTGRSSGPWLTNLGYFVGTRLSLPNAAKGEVFPENIGTRGAYFGTTRLTVHAPSWNLSAPAYPADVAEEPKRWASVASFGARPDSGSDATDAIRAALNSGARVVYFPSGTYEVSDVLDVPASVRRLVGMFSVLVVAKQRRPAFTPSDGMFRIGTGGEPLTIDRFAIDYTNRGRQVGIQHTGSRSVVLRDMILVGAGIERGIGGGPLFLDNSSVGPLFVAGKQQITARQLNTEGGGIRIRNAGAPLWVLGLKVEQDCTVVDNEDGATTEILGGLLYPTSPIATGRAAFVNELGASLSVAYAESAYQATAVYATHVAQVARDGGRSLVTADGLPKRGLARIVPFLTSRTLSKPAVSP